MIDKDLNNIALSCYGCIRLEQERDALAAQLAETKKDLNKAYREFARVSRILDEGRKLLGRWRWRHAAGGRHLGQETYTEIALATKEWLRKGADDS